MRIFSRRKFIRILAGSGFGFVIPKLPFFAGFVTKDSKYIIDYVNQLDSIVSAKIIGMNYLNAYPEENNYSTLLEKINIALENHSDLKNENINPQILKIIKADFASENIVNLNGWILSRTEVRIYAIAALS